MIGWPGGQRSAHDNHGIVAQQVILADADAASAWMKHFPFQPKTPFPQRVAVRGVWPHEMALIIQGEGGQPPLTLQMQSATEKNEWKRTLNPHPSFNHFLTWESPRLLRISCEPTGAAAVDAVTPQKQQDISEMDDRQLRTFAAQILHLDVDPEEPRADLEARVREAMAKGSPLSEDDEAELP